MGSAIVAAIADEDLTTLAGAIVNELIPVIADDVDPITFDPRDGNGNVFKAVVWQEQIWFRNEDNTDDHDEITVITLADGVNYLTNEFNFPNSVLSRSLTTPPTITDSPPAQFGDCYLVPDGATDEWAGHEDERAILTARGWQFRPGAHGEIVLVEDEGDTGEFVHFSAADVWEDGLPGNLTDLSVRPSALLIRFWEFENQTTTAPPASGPAAEQYVIGASATGAWAGNDKKIAWRPSTDAAFVITTPKVGERGFDKNLGSWVEWSGSIWKSASGVVIDGAEVVTDALGGDVDAGTTSDYPTSLTVGPGVGSHGMSDLAVLDYASKKAEAVLEVHYSAIGSFVGGAGETLFMAVGLFRATAGVYETQAVDWRYIMIKFQDGSTGGSLMPVDVFLRTVTPSTATFTYKIRILRTDAGRKCTGIARRRLTIKERA
jgi:hypothetical protein